METLINTIYLCLYFRQNNTIYLLSAKGVKELNNINIQKIRLERGISQAELAKTVGVTRQTINMIENGKVKNPKKETIFAIAKALMVDVDKLKDPT